MPERDVMLLYLTHTTGILVTELALLEGGRRALLRPRSRLES